MMAEQYIPDKAAAKRLGHKSPLTTKKYYQHATDTMDEEAADIIDKAFKN